MYVYFLKNLQNALTQKKKTYYNAALYLAYISEKYIFASFTYWSFLTFAGTPLNVCTIMHGTCPLLGLGILLKAFRNHYYWELRFVGGFNCWSHFSLALLKKLISTIFGSNMKLQLRTFDPHCNLRAIMCHI